MPEYTVELRADGSPPAWRWRLKKDGWTIGTGYCFTRWGARHAARNAQRRDGQAQTFTLSSHESSEKP